MGEGKRKVDYGSRIQRTLPCSGRNSKSEYRNPKQTAIRQAAIARTGGLSGRAARAVRQQHPPPAHGQTDPRATRLRQGYGGQVGGPSASRRRSIAMATERCTPYGTRHAEPRRAGTCVPYVAGRNSKSEYRNSKQTAIRQAAIVRTGGVGGRARGVRRWRRVGWRRGWRIGRRGAGRWRIRRGSRDCGRRRL